MLELLDFQIQPDVDSLSLSVAHKPASKPTSTEEISLCDQMHDPHDKLVAFKLVHAAPNHLKRPLSSVDSLNTNHVVLRLYPIVHQDPAGKFIRVRWQHFADVACEPVKPPDFQEHLKEWTLDVGNVFTTDSI